MLQLQTADSPISKKQIDISHCTIKHKMTSNTKCHFYKNDTINTINTNIKYITLHTNKIKHTQQNNITIIIYTHNIQIKTKIKLTLDTECQFVNKVNINDKNIKIKIRIYNINTYTCTYTWCSMHKIKYTIYKQINKNNKMTNGYYCDKNITLTNKNIKIKYNKNNGTTNTCVRAHSAYDNKYNKYKQNNKNERMTNDTKYHCDINITLMNKKIKMNINNKAEECSTFTQVHSVYKPKNSKHTQLKTMTNDTKCHFDINVIFMNKNIKTKINKNTENKATCVQAYSMHETKNRKFIYLKKNSKTMTNDTKCYFEINIIVMYKNIKIKINVKNNNDRDVCANT
jgi:hypothetical protein